LIDGNRFSVSVIAKTPREAKIAAGAAAAAAAAVAVRELAHRSDDQPSSGPSREFRLRRREPLPYGVRRVARGRLDSAVEGLRDPDADGVEAVHEARKDLKKLRSTLRLVRPVVGEDAYRRENERYRDASRLLSETRDAQVLAETIDALEHRFSDQQPPGGWGEIKGALAPRGADDGAEIDRLRGRAAAEIEAGRGEIESLSLPGEGFDVVAPGLRRAYSRGRKRLAEAASEPSDERLHEWRKRSKDLWYQLRLLRPAWRPVLEPLADQARELTDLLGDDHDLVVLEGRTAETDIPLSDEQRRDLGELIARRRAELQARAFALGERLYAEKPKAFARRIGAYWEAPRI
jgi:CHAD domain-containing protein